MTEAADKQAPSEMIERAAQAAYMKWQKNLGIGAFPPWETLPPLTREAWCDAQRAAFEALRDPTEAMVEAAHREAWDLDIPPRPFTLERIWRAMIDAALRKP